MFAKTTAKNLFGLRAAVELVLKLELNMVTACKVLVPVFVLVWLTFRQSFDLSGNLWIDGILSDRVKFYISPAQSRPLIEGK